MTSSAASARGQAKRSTENLARTQIRVAVELIACLHAHGMTLRELRQQHLDRWLADDSTTRRRIRAFLTWARSGSLLPALDAPPSEARRHIYPLGTDRRLRLVGTLLADDTLDLRDGVAGCLLLIFAQPVTRLVRLTVDDVDDRAASRDRLATGESAHCGADASQQPDRRGRR